MKKRCKIQCDLTDEVQRCFDRDCRNAIDEEGEYIMDITEVDLFQQSQEKPVAPLPLRLCQVTCL